MLEFFASMRRGKMPCALISGTLVLLAPFVAQARASETAEFSQTAIPTHWALQPSVLAMAVLSEPTLGTSSDFKAATAETDGTPARISDVSGPEIASSDLVAEGLAASRPTRARKTPADVKKLEAAFQLLNAADAITTIVCLNRNDCHEANPIYGRQPKPIVVVGAKAMLGGFHYWVMRRIAPEHPGLARAFGWFTVSVQGSVVGINIAHLI